MQKKSIFVPKRSDLTHIHYHIINLKRLKL